MEIANREQSTPSGNKVVSPETTILPLEALESLDRAILEVTNATGQEVYAAYLNPDRDEDGRLHSLKLVFRK